VEQIAGVAAAGGEIWMGDETMLREFPPLRASWSRRGEQKRVVVSGRNPSRVLLGALNVVTGQVVRLVRERCRTADTAAFVEKLGQMRPEVPKLLIWDNAPPHHPQLVQQAAAEAHIQSAFLPFRAPELMPCEDLWRQLKAVVAANRVYADLTELVIRALAWLDAIPPEDSLRRTGVTSSKFEWLST
jgi:transposase